MPKMTGKKTVVNFLQNNTLIKSQGKKDDK